MEKKYKLEKEFGQKWLEALRGGEYIQGSGYLKNDEGHYCCLGVACHMMMPSAKFKEAGYIEIPKKGNIATTTTISKELYYKVPKLLRGTHHQNEFVKIVSEMNDEGKSFEEIAKFIKDNVEFI